MLYWSEKPCIRYAEAVCNDAPAGAFSFLTGGAVTKRPSTRKYGKLVLVLLGICGALLLIRWAAIIWA